MDSFEGLADSYYSSVQSTKCEKHFHKSKFVKQGKNGEKGRRTRKYFTARITDERRAYAKKSQVCGTISGEFYPDLPEYQDSTETVSQSKSALSNVHTTNNEEINEEFDSDTYFGKLTNDGMRENFDENGRTVQALRDQYGDWFADELENMSASCYFCGRSYGCAC